jgi:hypothetical protein
MAKTTAKPKTAPASTPSAADRVRGWAPLTIDGTEYRLIYSFNAIADAESLAGCNLLHGISAALISTMTAAQMRGLFYAALKPLQPALTLAEVGAMIRIDTLPGIFEAITLAYSLAMPEKKKNPPVAAPVPVPVAA